MRHRLELLAPLREEDGAGGATLSWSSVETVWAGLERLASTRDFTGDRARRLRRVSATIRWRSDVAPGGRVRFEGRDYDIVSVEAGDGPERFLTLICEEALS